VIFWRPSTARSEVSAAIWGKKGLTLFSARSIKGGARGEGERAGTRGRKPPRPTVGRLWGSWGVSLLCSKGREKGRSEKRNSARDSNERMKKTQAEQDQGGSPCHRSGHKRVIEGGGGDRTKALPVTTGHRKLLRRQRIRFRGKRPRELKKREEGPPPRQNGTGSQRGGGSKVR